MAVRKTSIFGEVYLFSDIVVGGFSKAAFGEILVSIRCPKILPIRSGSCFEHPMGLLNTVQSDNRTVNYVVSCCVGFKQIKVSTILASVESTGSWLHAGTCSVFVR